MPLVRNNIEDPRFTKQLKRIERRNQFIHALAGMILPNHEDFESVLSIANRVYDRHCSPRAGYLNRYGLDRSAPTALSA